jgi:hypothetical protein
MLFAGKKTNKGNELAEMPTPEAFLLALPWRGFC